MKPKRIILVRHGESLGNIDKSIYSKLPDHRLPLTQKGKTQAEKCGKVLKNITKDETCFFYVSPLFRTRETFREIRKSFNISPEVQREEPRIREQEWGHMRDEKECKRIDKERDAFGPFYYRIPDGESAADVYDRVSDFFGTLHRDFEKPDFPENCILVTHGMTIRLFLMKWFHWVVEDFDNLKNPENCAIIILEKRKDEKYELLSELNKRK